MKKSNLYLILDTSVNDYDELLKIAKVATRSGVDIIQLRDKAGSAKDIIKFSEKIIKIKHPDSLYIMNDRVDLAKVCNASGVHLGQDDIDITAARKILGTKAVIGQSCQTFKHAKDAQRKGADYIGFGSVFKTLTKPERSDMDLNLLSEIVEKIDLPMFAIGGITLKNISGLKFLGVQRVAVCREISKAKDIAKTVGKFKNILES